MFFLLYKKQLKNTLKTITMFIPLSEEAITAIKKHTDCSISCGEFIDIRYVEDLRKKEISVISVTTAHEYISAMSSCPYRGDYDSLVTALSDHPEANSLILLRPASDSSVEWIEQAITTTNIKKIIYFGEYRGGCDGSDLLFDMLEEKHHQILEDTTLVEFSGRRLWLLVFEIIRLD